MTVYHYFKAPFFLFLSFQFASSHPLNQKHGPSISQPVGCIVYVNARDASPMPATTALPDIHATGSPKPCDGSEEGIVKRTVTIYPTPEPEVSARNVEFLDSASILVRNEQPAFPTTTSTTMTTIRTIVRKQDPTTDYVNACRTAISQEDANLPSPTPTGCPAGYVNARGEPVDPSINPHLEVRRLKCLPFPSNTPEATRCGAAERDIPDLRSLSVPVNARRATEVERDIPDSVPVNARRVTEVERDIPDTSSLSVPVNARRAAKAEPDFLQPNDPGTPVNACRVVEVERDIPQPNGPGSLSVPVNARRAAEAEPDFPQPNDSGTPVNARRAAEAEPTVSLTRDPSQLPPPTQTDCPDGYVNARGVPAEDNTAAFVNAREEPPSPDGSGFINARDNLCTPPGSSEGAQAS